MSEQKSNLVEIINKIEKNQILLPDFQREFVWKDEDQQKQLVASVLCKMPVGSILLLESDPDDYAAKVIGCSKKQVATTQINGEVEFLLDGQQRLTVLTNVFSNIIHDNCPKVSELIAPMALKRRFFLKLPKWKDRPDKEEDWFGIGNLEFPIENPNTDLPPFLTSQILKYIHVESFNANDKKPYNPAEKLTPLLDEYCTSFRDGYLIPMFLMATPIGKNKSSIVLRFGDIIEKVAKAIASEIKAAYRDYATTSEKDEFTKYIFADDADNIYSQLDKTQAFDDEVDARSKIWTSQIKEYLSSCINSIFLSQIVVEASQRARAIDIYENLNRGGVCLNTFDLIMARVAKVNKENFSSRMHKLMMSQKNYPEKVLPDKMRVILSSKIQNHTYNATENTGCYNASNNDLNSKYVDIFLDVLSIYSYVPDLNPDTIKLDHIKKGFILNLKPEQIDQNCEKTITAIDRSMFFLQTRCGIRTLQEVNYALVVVLIAVVFLEDTYFYDRDVHDLLEGWYWSVLFSGEYDKDQNTTFINNLKNMLKTVKKQLKTDWIESIKKNVFSMTNFSEKSLLLMDKVSEDRYPKRVMISFVCQYMLAQTYPDMFDSNKTVSVFSPDAANLEAHHVIPLGTAKKVGEVTANIRKDPKHICNSPLNFVLITKEANKAISDDALDIYAKKITPGAKSALNITSYVSEDSASTSDKIHSILENRFDMLNGNVQTTINNKLMNWK
ncbi:MULTISPECIES: DUF262 domain-containing protein [Clostridium]|uniref:DUF262 domain-containing protein n=1 Tax=Clostridium TaxID=1485 RepID=UPI000E4E7978|nr:DUF262 domain-containing protein [Clostridium fessum]RHQ89598.1 DUF262 domain-containing protein [Clostridium sp. AF21-20LB]